MIKRISLVLWTLFVVPVSASAQDFPRVGLQLGVTERPASDALMRPKFMSHWGGWLQMERADWLLNLGLHGSAIHTRVNGARLSVATNTTRLGIGKLWTPAESRLFEQIEVLVGAQKSSTTSELRDDWAKVRTTDIELQPWMGATIRWELPSLLCVEIRHVSALERSTERGGKKFIFVHENAVGVSYDFNN